jgi:phospholipase C
MPKRRITLFLALSLIICSCSRKKDNFDNNIKKVKHVVVIYMENHSFDNLWGGFEGADGLSDAADSNITQVDKNGKVYTNLPEIPRNKDFPTNLPNHYFNIDQYVPADKKTSDVTHSFYPEQNQINVGKMNKYAAYNKSKGLAMGYYKTEDLPLYPIAKRYTLCDHFFHSAFGDSYFNHIFLIAARPAVWKDAPSDMVVELDSTGKVIKGGKITSDGYSIGYILPKNGPYPSKADTSRLLPPQTFETIGDRLNDKDISWAWYSQGWDKAEAGKPSNYAWNHEPFAFFENYAPGTENRKEHLKDENDFLKAAKEGTLPAVSFVKPGSGYDQHPGSGTVLKGGKHALELINAVKNSPNWDSTLVILTYDENGGFWDHVAPPKIDRWGPGTRIPAIIISPFAKKGYVDHTQYETVSILSFIEKRWDLKPLTDRDKNANPLQNVFDFSNKDQKQD